MLQDTAIDDRDCGVLETAKGTLLVTTFSSLAYEPLLEKAIRTNLRARKIARWKAARDACRQERMNELGCWALRSTDGGLSWSARIDTLVNSPHGPIQLLDGRLLYAGKQLWTDTKRIGVCESNDDGVTWQWLSEIPTRAGDSVPAGYHELHAVEAADGTLAVQIRITTSRINLKRSKASPAMEESPGVSRIPSACGACHRICCVCAMGGC